MQSNDIITSPNYQYFDDNYDITLYRGLKKTPLLDTTIPFKFRESSKSTPPLINHHINERLTELYGLPIRNLLYTTNDYKQAKGYGDAYKVKPVGNNFKIYYGVGGLRFHGRFKFIRK